MDAQNSQTQAIADVEEFTSGILSVCAPSDPKLSSVNEVFQAVTSSNWRRSAIDASSALDIRTKIADAMTANQPIEFSVPFGGYKSWHEPAAPGVNWAEVFWISYQSRHGARIAATYAPGVAFSLSYAGGVMDLVSNLPANWQERYVTELSLILDHFSTPTVRFRLVDISGFYGGARGLREVLLQRYEEFQHDWPLNERARSAKLASARRNLYLDGPELLRELPTAALERRIAESAMMCDALDSLEKRRHFNKYATRIQLVFVRGPVHSLHVGSCTTSSMHPWVGTGVAEFVKSRARLQDRIISLGTAAPMQLRNCQLAAQLPLPLPVLGQMLLLES